jgi:hypothetical protein
MQEVQVFVAIDTGSVIHDLSRSLGMRRGCEKKRQQQKSETEGGYGNAEGEDFLAGHDAPP